MLGFNDGNGHPFSYSAILNGYDEKLLRASGWGIIADYLPGPKSEGLSGVNASVVSVWGPDKRDVEALVAACYIPHIAESPSDFLGSVDAVIIARDDWEKHLEFALPLLESGMPLFVDKPLTLNVHELRRLRPYLSSGQLASWSGHRFSPELRALIAGSSNVKAIHASAIGDWERYAIHVIEPALAIKKQMPIRATRRIGQGVSVAYEFNDETQLTVDMLGAAQSHDTSGFSLDITNEQGRERVRLLQRFEAFSRSLGAFVEQLETGILAVNPDDTTSILLSVIAGQLALRSKVSVDMEPLLTM